MDNISDEFIDNTEVVSEQLKEDLSNRLDRQKAIDNIMSKMSRRTKRKFAKKLKLTFADQLYKRLKY